MEWEERQDLPQRQGKRRSAAAILEADFAAATLEETSGGSTSFENRRLDTSHNTADQSGDDGERQELREGAEPGQSFEYLDHTADVQLHAWGPSLREAFANAALAMFNYMTPLEGIRKDEACSRTVSAEAHDMESLLFNFLDEALFLFSTELIVFSQIEVVEMDLKGWTIKACGQGEKFERGRHASGTEVKAITYSAMQVNELTMHGDAEVFVIVDI